MTPSKTSSLVLVLALLAAGVLSACGKQEITAELLAAEASKRATLPMDLGDGFRLDSITAEGNAVVSTVTFTNAELAADPAFVELMRTATTSDICREIAPAKQAYIDANLSVAKVFKNPQGSQLLRVDVKPAECS